MYGNLPSESQLADWEFAISQHSAVPQGTLVRVSINLDRNSMIILKMVFKLLQFTFKSLFVWIVSLLLTIFVRTS